MNEVKSFVKSGLRDISVSRSRLKWGIPWPGDPHQVFYVWYDALTSYMTGIGYAQGENGSTPSFRNIGAMCRVSQRLFHMIGKDILRFHAVYWPAFIMAAYPDQPEMLPTTVFAHGWIYYEQDKMSKSKGNVVYPEPIVDALDSFGAPGNDALRYYLLREAPFGQDTSFSYEGLIQRYNSDLANGLGNLANRTLSMIHRYSERSNSHTPVNTSRRSRKYSLRSRWRPRSGDSGKSGARSGTLQCLRLLGRAWSQHGASLRLPTHYLVERQPWTLAQDLSKNVQLAMFFITQRKPAIPCVLLLPSSSDFLRATLAAPRTTRGYPVR